MQGRAHSLPREVGAAVPLQMKALVTNKLNVAGETHGESNRFRMLEKAYAKDKGGGEYWQEGAYTYYKDATTIFGARVPGTGTKAAGDPYLLRLRMLLKNFEEKILPMAEELDDWGYYADVLRTIPDDQKPLVVETLIESLSSTLKELLICINKVVEMNELDDADILEALFNEIAKHHRNFNGRYIADEKDLQGFANQYHQAGEAILGAANKALPGLSQQTEEDVSGERSAAMHQAARSKPVAKGLWKVGNSHVADILKDHGYPDDYNLMKKDEFYADFRTWIGQKKLKGWLDDKAMEILDIKPDEVVLGSSGGSVFESITNL